MHLVPMWKISKWVVLVCEIKPLVNLFFLFISSNRKKENLMENNKLKQYQECFCLTIVSLIVTLGNFMFFKQIFKPKKQSFKGFCVVFKNIKFLWGDYRPVLPQQKHSNLFIKYVTSSGARHVDKTCRCEMFLV